MAEIQHYDLVVVGTGFHGLPVAQTYLEVHPTASVQLYDNGPTPGGVWSADRLYPGLKTNNPSGTYEFGDFPMIAPELKVGQAIPAKTVHNYLTTYSDNYDLTRRTQFHTKVETVEQQGTSGWLLTIRATLTGQEVTSKVFASKLVVAAGLTSFPWMPAFKGKDDFNAFLFHSKDFAVRADTLKECKNVVVLGGSKSAWDAVHAYASVGVQVDWVLRSSGHGACWVSKPYVMGPLKVLAANLINTRWVTWLSPCIWGEADEFKYTRRFFNQTWMGRKFIDGFTALVQVGATKVNGYDNHPETKKLKPWSDLFWSGSNRGILNYDTDVFQLVRDGKIRVHISDVSHLSDHAVHLSDLTILKADALICCTGWKHALPMQFLRDGQDITAELGLPHRADTFPSSLMREADAEILTKFPRLADQPGALPPSSLPAKGLIEVPYCLYRFMIPTAYIRTRTIAFAGIMRSGSTPLVAQVQALWITAFLGGQLPHLAHADERELQYETLLHSRFGKWRHPKGFGAFFPDCFFDALPYIDLCLNELGLKFKRKGGLWKEMTKSYGPKDYKGLTKEWMKKDERATRSFVEKRSAGNGVSWPRAVLSLRWNSSSWLGKGVGGWIASVVCLLVLLNVVAAWGKVLE